MSTQRPSGELAKTVNDFYPDLQQHGGLPQALQSALHDIGSSLTASASTFSAALVSAQVRSGARHAQIFVAEYFRGFSCNFFARGVQLAGGGMPDLTEVARAIDMWMTSDCTAAALAAAFPFVVPDKDAAIYERGEETEHHWQYFLAQTSLPTHPFIIPFTVPFIVAASRRPELRQLFPFMSLYSFRFSRCTGYPFSGDTPYVRPTGPGRFQLYSCSHEELAIGTADETVELAVRQLPRDCGPARAGTAVELGLPVWSIRPLRTTSSG